MNASTVTGRPRGRNHSLPEPIRLIKKRAAMIASISNITIVKILLYANWKSVRIIHAADIDTSLKSDHRSPLLIIRSMIVQIAIPEKAIIPLSSQSSLFRPSILTGDGSTKQPIGHTPLFYSIKAFPGIFPIFFS